MKQEIFPINVQKLLEKDHLGINNDNMNDNFRKWFKAQLKYNKFILKVESMQQGLSELKIEFKELGVLLIISQNQQVL